MSRRVEGGSVVRRPLPVGGAALHCDRYHGGPGTIPLRHKSCQVPSRSHSGWPARGILACPDVSALGWSLGLRPSRYQSHRPPGEVAPGTIPAPRRGGLTCICQSAIQVCGLKLAFALPAGRLAEEPPSVGSPHRCQGMEAPSGRLPSGEPWPKPPRTGCAQARPLGSRCPGLSLPAEFCALGCCHQRGSLNNRPLTAVLRCLGGGLTSMAPDCGRPP